MKELWRYKFFDNTISSLILVIFLIFMSKEWEVIKIILFLSIVLFLIYTILLLDEYHKSIQIKKNGRFILGKLDKESLKFHYIPQTRYLLKACVKYYDEERKMTIRFQGNDIITTREIGMGRIKEIVNGNEEVEVLVGYLKEDPKVCELYLKDAFERTY